ncbi:methyltransferase domain-containing protein [Rhabdaerophilum sp. SD176]|uniref:methyltransferase domain-containing protein n=1 Tax=Rhabdaerophilum sp. SD176 TaxID=2983548 RepID=UPI0024DF5269|nr:methyltransferase domain-containing protein [Rhabdaerophilum sp. SD176]
MASASGTIQTANKISIQGEASPLSSFRLKRFAYITALIDKVVAEKGSARILDVGGTAEYWLAVEPLWKRHDVHFTLVNLQAERVSDPRFTSLAGNACAMPEFADNSFDIVHSNSVIEHVGRWAAMRAMAAEVQRLAPCYYVQTPAFGFPIEPHFRAPFFHWLPMPMRIWWTRHMALGAFPKAATLDDAMRFCEDAIMVDAVRFRALFPEPARMIKERFFGLTKSFIAIRD